MQVKMLEKKKKFLRFNIIGETHTFSNVLRESLNGLDSVDFASYNQEHPSSDVFEFIIQSKKDAMEDLTAALDLIEKESNSFKEQISSSDLGDPEEDEIKEV